MNIVIRDKKENTKLENDLSEYCLKLQQENKELKKINEEHQKINGWLRIEVKTYERMLKKIANNEELSTGEDMTLISFIKKSNLKKLSLKEKI